MHSSFRNLMVVAAVVSLALPSVASAESFSGLVKQGYSVGKLDKGKSGALGWIVSKGGKQLFCRMQANMAYVGKADMVSFTTGGRMIKMNKAVFEAGIGGPDPSLPQLADLKAGRVRPADVGACSPLR